ncbi:MAG: OmpA family protein [Paracoccaceae bacterium]|nr:OmpA family protein [Paracoccaceae bacterium]
MRAALATAILAAVAAHATPAAPAGAATLELPAAADRAAARVEAFGSYAVPTAPWSAEGLETLPAEGHVSLEAWQVPSGATTLQLLVPLRDQLAAQGYSVLFECQGDGCGGFDFRYETEVLPEPEMHVDLADFRFLAAGRAGEAPDYVTLLVSRTSSTGYVQVARVGPPPVSEPDVDLISKTPAALPAPDSAAPAEAPLAAADLTGALEATGRAVLDDLSFGTGSSRLAEGDFASLASLADYLAAHPGRRITLVGHTDAEGSLTANIALSRARARSVMQRLIDAGVPAAQVEADGVGYLMPLASNLTDEGRTSNRRVEVVLTSIE